MQAQQNCSTRTMDPTMMLKSDCINWIAKSVALCTDVYPVEMPKTISVTGKSWVKDETVVPLLVSKKVPADILSLGKIFPS